MRKPATLILPLLLLAGIYWLLTSNPHQQEPPGQSPTPEPTWQTESFAAMPPGELPANWAAPRGTLQIVEKDGRRALCFQPEPMVEGRILVPGVLRGRGSVRARFSGESSRRSHPRFAVGLNNEREFHLRYLPGEKRLALVTPTSVLVNQNTIPEDKILTTAALDLPASTPLWIELGMNAEGVCEGRAWAEGTERPAHATFTYSTGRAAGLLHATILAAPFALKPVYVERVEWR